MSLVWLAGVLPQVDGMDAAYVKKNYMIVIYLVESP